MADRWFGAVDSNQVVGRIVEIDKPWTAGSKEHEQKTGQKTQLYRKVPCMLAKTAGQHDESYDELKEWKRDAICARFPGAWEHYLAEKAAREQGGAPPEVTVAPKGMSIDHADFIPRATIEALKLKGFGTVEQIATMSDAQIQTLGAGARTWQKKAKQLLAKG
jgi:hypothetical protein